MSNGSIPPGNIPIGETSWTDETGRTWNSFGSLILHDDLIQSTRQRFANFLRTVYLESINVYDYPPDVLYAPCIVLNPTDPYIVPYDQGGPKFALWGLDAMLVVNRGKTDESLNRLEFMWSSLQEDIKGFPNARWISFGEISTTTISDIEYLTGTVTLGIVDEIMQT